MPTAENRGDGAKGAAEILHRADLGDAEKIQARIKEYETRFANPFVAAERGYIDEVIFPHSTRRRVAAPSGSCAGKHMELPWKKHDTSRSDGRHAAGHCRAGRNARYLSG